MQDEPFPNDAAPSPYATDPGSNGTPEPTPQALPRDATGSTTQQGNGYSYFNPWGEAMFICPTYIKYANFAGFSSHYCQCFDQDASPCGSYNPQQGRWLNPGGNPNPLDPQSFDQYAYNENNPIDTSGSSDPSTSDSGEGKTLFAFTDPSTAGPQQDIINATLNRLLANLPNDPQCLSFLSKGGPSPLDLIRELEADHSVGHSNIFFKGDPLAIVALSYPPLWLKQTITVNNHGAFFNSTVGDTTLTVEGYPGGSPAAQAFTLLHELGHLENVLENDADNPGAERRNNADVEKNCKKTVKACSKRR